VIGFDHQGPFRAVLPLVLASASPRRQRLLASLGLEFEVVPSRVKEPLPAQGQDPVEYALANAGMKAAEIAAGRPDAVVLGADTIVVTLGPQGKILGKPKNHAEAEEMLRMLCAGWHQVVTGCTLFHPEAPAPISYAAVTEVRMDAPLPESVQAYVRTGEPMGKAGAYAIQGIGGFLVREIRGSSSNVVGLPLNETVHALVSLGAIRIAQEGMKHG
jgi:septum formation protein